MNKDVNQEAQFQEKARTEEMMAQKP